MSIKKIAIFASGRGSNAEALFKKALNLPNICVELLVCDQPQAGVLKLAQKYNIQSLLHPFPIKTPTKSIKERRIEFASTLSNAIKPHNIDWILLAGFMRILPAIFLKQFEDPCGLNRVINIHPSLLPKYKGLHGYEQCFEACDPVGGVTLHFVDSSLDGGAVIQQKSFPRYPTDTLDAFKKRGLALEHQLCRSLLEDLAFDRHVFSLFRQESS